MDLGFGAGEGSEFSTRLIYALCKQKLKNYIESILHNLFYKPDLSILLIFDSSSINLSFFIYPI